MQLTDEVVRVSHISKVRIVRTVDTSDLELKGIQEKGKRDLDELNRTSRGVVFLGPVSGYSLDDIGETGDDVTSTFILGPPGHGDKWTVVAAVLNHPWISGIGTGLILAALVWALGWSWLPSS